MNLNLEFEIKKPSGTYSYFSDSFDEETYKQYLFDDYFYSEKIPFWRVFQGDYKEAEYFFVIHCMNKSYKLDFECIFLRKKDYQEALDSFNRHFKNSNLMFCGLEVFPAGLFEMILQNAKMYKKPVISCKEDFEYLEEVDIIDKNYKCVAYRNFGNEYFHCIDNPLRPKYFVEGEFETFHNINFDFDNFQFNKDGSNIKSLVKSQNDFYYSKIYSDTNKNSNDFQPENYKNLEDLEQEYHIGKFSEISVVNQDLLKSLERKIRAPIENHFEKPSKVDMQFMKDKIDFDIKRVAAFILNKISPEVVQQKNNLELVKEIINCIKENRSDIYLNYGIAINNHNTKKIIKYVLEEIKQQG